VEGLPSQAFSTIRAASTHWTVCWSHQDSGVFDVFKFGFGLGLELNLDFLVKFMIV
jgi:hypothetical protein